MGILLVALVVLFIMKPDIKLGYKNYNKKEGFQTVADVKLARAKAGAREAFANMRVGKSKEGFQTMPTMNTSNIIAANPIPMNTNRPTTMPTTTPSVVTLANNAQMPSVTMNNLSNAMMSGTMATTMPTTMPTMPTMPNQPASVSVGTPTVLQQFTNMNDMQASEYRKNAKEGFTSGNYAMTAGGANTNYEPMGAFDNVRIPTGNNSSSWRYTAPDEQLLGAPFQVGQDNLFMFKNNQCKPECCGSSFSCSGGCVCTTPDQRQYIASRGGNRTSPAED